MCSIAPETANVSSNYSPTPGPGMGLLPDTHNCGLCMRQECRERFPRHHGLAIPTCITARASRTCRDACRYRKLPVSFEVGGGENVPGIPGACATRNFAYLVRGPLAADSQGVPTVATGVSKSLCCRLTLAFTLTSENLSLLLYWSLYNYAYIQL